MYSMYSSLPVAFYKCSPPFRSPSINVFLPSVTFYKCTPPFRPPSIIIYVLLPSVTFYISTPPFRLPSLYVLLPFGHLLCTNSSLPATFYICTPPFCHLLFINSSFPVTFYICTPPFRSPSIHQLLPSGHLLCTYVLLPSCHIPFIYSSLPIAGNILSNIYYSLLLSCCLFALITLEDSPCPLLSPHIIYPIS